jgi:hypothetical protein
VNEPTRHRIYLGAAALIVVLILIDVARGGDVAGWVAYIAAAVGLGAAGLAAANTSTSGD